MLEPEAIERVAGALRTDPALVEKDWHVVRAIGVIAALDATKVRPVFSGGTSLAKAFGLIKRFSEDVDFKVSMPGGGRQSARRRYGRELVAVLASADFSVVGEPVSVMANTFYRIDLAYEARFPVARGLRPHVRIEMSFTEPMLRPIDRPVQSFLSLAERGGPEVQSIPCIDPIETAADKLSALAWRVVTRKRGGPKDDPAIVRHLHDLAALESRVAGAGEFATLVKRAVADDAGRGDGAAPADTDARFAAMLDRLRADQLWAREYEEFVSGVSFAKPEERIGFADALEACRRLVGVVGTR